MSQNQISIPLFGLMICPVIDGWVRILQISSAISSGVEILCKGRLPLRRYILSSSPDHHRVEIAAGAIQFTRISGARALAKDFVRQWTAALDAAYGSDEPDPVIPAILPMFRIAQSFNLLIIGATAREQ